MFGLGFVYVWSLCGCFFLLFFILWVLFVQRSTELPGEEAVHDDGAGAFIKRGHYGEKWLLLTSTSQLEKSEE